MLELIVELVLTPILMLGFWLGLALAGALVWLISYYIWGEFNVSLFIPVACLFGGIGAYLQHSYDNSH